MKMRLAQRCLSLYGGESDKRAEAMATVLREADLLPKGGRGLHAPTVTEIQVALFACAVAASERVADAAETAVNLIGLQNREGMTLGLVLMNHLAGITPARGIRYVRLMPNIGMAEVTYRGEAGDHTDRFFDAERWSDSLFSPDAQGQGFVGRIGHIGGAALDQLAIHFAETDEETEAQSGALERVEA